MVPSGNKPLPEPMLTQIYAVISRVNKLHILKNPELTKLLADVEAIPRQQYTRSHYDTPGKPVNTHISDEVWDSGGDSAASFIKEVNPWLAKCPLKSNGCLANRGLTSSVKEATCVRGRLWVAAESRDLWSGALRTTYFNYYCNHTMKYASISQVNIFISGPFSNKIPTKDAP